MIVLQNDMKELFSAAISKGTSSSDKSQQGWFCSFLKQAPIVICDFSGGELMEDDLLHLLLDHEVRHYQDMFVVLPILLHHWLILFSIIDLQKYLIRKKGESPDLVIHPQEIPDLYDRVYPPHLDGVFAKNSRKGKVWYDLVVPLEALALTRSLASFPSKTTDRFISEAFGSIVMQERVNALHSFALDCFQEIAQKIQAYHKNIFRSTLGAVNILPQRFSLQGIQDLADIFNTNLGLCKEYNNYSSKTTSLYNLASNSLLAFKSLRYNPEGVKPVLETDKSTYKLWLNRLFFPALAAIRRVYSDYPSFITGTTYKIANTLVFAFIWGIERYFHAMEGEKDSVWSNGENVALYYLRKQGTISPLAVCNDGRGIYCMGSRTITSPRQNRKGKGPSFLSPDHLSEEELSFLRKPDLWLDFLTLKTVLRWIQGQGNWVCPLYKFFSERIGGEKGEEFQKRFCGMPCSVLQSRRNGAVLNIEELDENLGNDGSCFFWKNVKEIFSDFRTVRVERN